MNTIAVIFHDADYYFSGGTRSMVDIIDSWMSDRNLRIVAIFPTKKGTAIEYLRSRGISVICSTYGLNKVLLTLDSKSLLRFTRDFFLWFWGMWETKVFLSKKLKAEGVDLLYTNTSTPPVGAWLKTKLGVPHIWHFREFGKEDQGFYRIWGTKAFYQTVNASTDAVVVISKAMGEKVGQNTKLPVTVIYDDISPHYINPKPTGNLTNRPLNLLIVGTLIKGKGQIQAIKAVERLSSRGLEVVLYIAGIGSEEYALRNYVKEHHLGSKVIFLGLVQDMNELRSKMQVGLVCSHCEAFGRITIEGMLSNMVMIGANTGSTPELVQNGMTGYLYTWNDLEDLAGKIEYVYRHPDIAEKISREGFSYGLSFTKGHCATECKALFGNYLQ
jgi:glycosyltransferase involved in cell wall biosynthesis